MQESHLTLTYWLSTVWWLHSLSRYTSHIWGTLIKHLVTTLILLILLFSIFCFNIASSYIFPGTLWCWSNSSTSPTLINNCSREGEKNVASDSWLIALFSDFKRSRVKVCSSHVWFATPSTEAVIDSTPAMGAWTTPLCLFRCFSPPPPRRR